MCAFAPAAAMLRGLSTIPNKPSQLLGHSDCGIEGRQGRYPLPSTSAKDATHRFWSLAPHLQVMVEQLMLLSFCSQSLERHPVFCFLQGLLLLSLRVCFQS